MKNKIKSFFIIILIIANLFISFAFINIKKLYNKQLYKINGFEQEISDLQNECYSKDVAMSKSSKQNDKFKSIIDDIITNNSIVNNNYSNLQIKYENLIKENSKIKSQLQDLKSEEYEFKYLGRFTITHYCCERYPHSCGLGTGITATGTEIDPTRTVAVDPEVIPYGTTLYIDGYGYKVAEDCGGEIDDNHIDIAVPTHQEAVELGTVYKDVWTFKKK